MSQKNELHGAEFFLRDQKLLRREEGERRSHLRRGESFKSRISYLASREIFFISQNPSFHFSFRVISSLIATLSQIFSVHTSRSLSLSATSILKFL